MKRVLFLIVIISFGFTVTHLYDEKVKKVLAQLKLSEDRAEQTIFQNFSGPSFYIPSVSELKKIAVGERSAITLTACNYIKEETSSQDFLKRYNEYRESRKPSPPEKPKSSAQMKEEYKASIKEGIANMEQLKKQMPDQKETWEETIKMYKEQLREVDNPDNPMFSKDMDKMMQDSYNQQMELHKQDLAKWEEEYPVNNPKKMIKKWLSTFLESSKDIDFNAALKEVNKRQVFVKPEYESKSYLWKLCFRSGKETVEAARTFAQNWLKELK
jgi:hypothetical protein